MWKLSIFLSIFKGMEKYPEIEKLKKIYLTHHITIKQLMPINKAGFVFVEMAIRSRTWKLYVDDEYKDFNVNKPLVSLFLALFSLEVYRDSTDYLEWCRQNSLSASETKWLPYYKGLESTYSEIKNILGEIDSCISPLDYQLRTGVIDALIECEI